MAEVTFGGTEFTDTNNLPFRMIILLSFATSYNACLFLIKTRIMLKMGCRKAERTFPFVGWISIRIFRNAFLPTLFCISFHHFITTVLQICLLGIFLLFVRRHTFVRNSSRGATNCLVCCWMNCSQADFKCRSTSFLESI